MAETDDPADRPTSVPETDKACDMLLEIVASLEEIDREMQLQRLKAFLFVARHPECNTRQLARMAGMSSSTMSRNLSSLGEWNPLAKKKATA
jgi:DNA-binding MarR family transcriptional regulator